MRNRHQGLFDSQAGHAVVPPQSPGPRPASSVPQASPRRGIPWGLLVGLPGVLFGLWVFLGEVVLPEPLRFSTFVGTRLGHIEGLSSKTAAPGQAEALQIQAGGQAAAVRIVAPSEAYAECVKRRQVAALEAYMTCTTGPEKLASSYCEFYRDKIMGQSCDMN